MEKIATALRLDPDEHKQLRVAAAQRHLTIQQALYEGFRLWMSCAGVPLSPGMNGFHRPGAGAATEQEHTDGQD